MEKRTLGATDLEVETIDLYQIHSPDDAVPIAESIGALQRLHEAGKIRHIGVSNFSRRIRGIRGRHLLECSRRSH